LRRRGHAAIFEGHAAGVRIARDGRTDQRGDAMTEHEASGESALKFPTVFPIKVMGRRADGFAQAVVDVVLKHAPDYEPATLEMRASREGNYLSVTVTINATSREQLDNLYRELTAHPMVAMVL
jgi:putative lipoic acid-binding regulatory protein